MIKLSRKVSQTSRTKFDERHEAMLIDVTSFATAPANLSTSQSVAAYYTSIMNIQGNLGTIRTLRGLSMISLTGYAEEKQDIKTALAGLMGDGMQAVYTYAAVNNNPVLANQMLVAPSTLNKMSYTSMLAFTETIIGIISPLATAGTLSTYNITNSTVSAWQAVWDQLNGAFSGPKNAIANRVALKKAMYGLLHDCMVIVTNQSDTLVRQIADVNYINSYASNRKLGEHHVSTQARVWITNLLGQPVTEGELFILGTANSGSPDSNGYCLINHIPFGEHQLSITTPHFEGMFGPYHFKKGHSLTLHIQIDQTQQEAPKVTVTETETPVAVEK